MFVSGGLENEPIAIIGIGCRFSGMATSPEGLWNMLSKGMTGWSKNASNRFNLDAFWHPKAEMKGSFNSKGLHFLKQDPGLFDNDFFGVSGLEAKAMDPQQRILLEVAYEAFENAGMTMDELEASQTGVYCAVSNADYESILARDPDISPGYRMTGTGAAILSNRISYIFDLRGPSMTIDTFCSSTLVALHEAVKALQSGDIKQALVGGSNLCLDPERIAVLSSMQFTSPDGRCYAFDPRASGYGRGEGIAAVVLKPLSVALADGDTIRAVIRGTGVSSDGKTAGITLPSVHGQVQALQMAYANAGLDPRETFYVEAHGTGTKAGDRTEATVWRNTFCNGRVYSQPLVVGSVKANLGHTEPTAGLAGLIKAVMILEKGVIPPTPTHQQLSQDVADALEGTVIQIATKNTPWPKDVVRRISVSTTGYGGTDAHVVIEHVDDILSRSAKGTRKVEDCPDDLPRIFVISHHRPDGLKEMAQVLKRSLSERWAQQNESLLSNLAFTLSKRSHLGYRSTFTASTIKELHECLSQIVKGAQRLESAGSRPRICFAFTGQGAQWAKMGVDLLPLYPVFAASMKHSEQEFLRFGADWNLLQELDKVESNSSIDQAWLSQPCCTAIQIAVVDLLNCWGIQPQVVCGHSSGEIAAAYAAGVLTSSEALKVAYFRGHHVENLRKSRPDLSGSMLAVGLSTEDVLKYLGDVKNVTVACINSPSSVTLSGDSASLLKVKETLDADSVFNRKLNVDVAYHSSYMKLVEDNYRSALKDIQPQPVKDGIQMISSVTESLINGNEMGAAYWAQNLTSPVHFSQALMKILKSREPLGATDAATTLIVEVGPRSALRGPITQIIKEAGVGSSTVYHTALKRDESCSKTLLELCGDLFRRGVTVDLQAINEPNKNRIESPELLVNLPHYVWHHEKPHWAESRRSFAYRFRQFPKHDILGTPTLDSISAEPTWRLYLRVSDLPWLQGHVIQDQIVFPGAGYVSMVAEALKEQHMIQKLRWKGVTIHFRQVVFTRVLLVPDTEVGIETVISLRPYSYSAKESSSSWYEFRIFTLAPDGRQSMEHCRGLVSVGLGQIDGNISRPKNPESAWTKLSSKKLYKELKALGANYKGHVSQLEDIQGGDGYAHCTFKIPDLRSDMPGEIEQPYCIHPLSLEAAFQSPFAALRLNDKLDAVYLLGSIDELHISTDVPSHPATVMCAETVVGPFGISKNKADILVSAGGNGTGQALIRAKGVIFAALDAAAQDPDDIEEESLCHYIDWIIDPFNSSSQSLRDWVQQQAVASSSQCHRFIFDRYCQSIIKHLLCSGSSKDGAQLVGFQSRLLEWMQSQNLDPAQDVSTNMEEELLALGAPGQTMVKFGNAFTQVLKGGANSSQFLLEDNFLHRLYVEDGSLQRCYAYLANYLRLCRLKTPKMRILEIGTLPGNLSPLVGRMISIEERSTDLKAKDCSCVYADITTTAPIAQSDFEDLGGLVEYKRLDFKQSLESQGFQAGSFDIIVATTLSHSVPDLPAALIGLRSLIKPQGTLTLVEITMPSLKWDMISRCQPNTFLGVGATDSKSRFLNAAQWKDILDHSGFTGFSEVRDSESEQEHEASLLIAPAISPVSRPTKFVTIISRNDEDRTAGYLASQIESENGHGSVVHTRLDLAIANENIFIFLLELSGPFLQYQTNEEWQKMKKLISRAGRVLWVTKNGALNCPEPANGLVTGYARSLRVEFQELRFITLDIDPLVVSESQIADDIHRIYATYLAEEMSAPKTNLEWEFAIRNGAVLVPRVFPHKITNRFIEDSTSRYHPQMTSNSAKDRALGLKIRSAGMLDTLHWTDMPEHRKSPEPDEVQVEIQVFSINSWDVMTAKGELDGNSTFLTEGAGIVKEVGQRIEGFNAGDVIYCFDPKGLATTCNIHAQRAVQIPHGMDIRTAVAVPLAYGTALHCLRDVARIQPGESILIHSAAEVVGQAAIALAKYYQAGEIFVTVGSSQEKDMLQSKWGILTANIFSSRDITFGAGILQRTQNRGVDIVLNSLTAEAVHEGCSILAPFGRFIEIGKHDILSNGRLEMKPLAKNATFTTVDMALFSEIKALALQEVFAKVLGLINTSQIQLFDPITVKPLSEIEESFRFMQLGKHVGKIVLDVATNMSLKIQPSPPKMARLREDASYLVVGGTGGLGKVIIRFLIRLGAKRIITMSRSGDGSPRMKEFSEEVRRKGIDLEVVLGSVADLDVVERIKKVSGEKVVRGVIHAATVFEDAPFEQMTFEQWSNGIQAKVTGTIKLYAVFGKSVDFFTMLSSVVGVQGTYAQVNYNAANAFQDAFARSCAAQNLPARSLDLSIVADEGQGAQAESIEFLERHGLRQISLDVVIAAVHYTILNPVASSPAHAQILCGFRQEHPDSGTKIAALQRADARFSHIWIRPSEDKSAGVKDGEYDVQSALQSSTSPQMAIQAVFTALKQHISQLLDVGESDIQPDRTVASYGLDSLTAIELKKWVNTRLSSAVQTLEIMNPISILNFAGLVARRSRLVNATVFEGVE